MGYMRHHAILVTSYDDKKIELAHAKALGLHKQVSPIVASGMNGYSSFAVFPDGSKEGWEASNVGDRARDALIQWLRSQTYGLDWVELQYGDDERESKVTRHSDDGR